MLFTDHGLVGQRGDDGDTVIERRQSRLIGQTIAEYLDLDNSACARQRNLYRVLGELSAGGRICLSVGKTVIVAGRRRQKGGGKKKGVLFVGEGQGMWLTSFARLA